MVERIGHTGQTLRLFKRFVESRITEEETVRGLNALYTQGQKLLEERGKVRRVDFYGKEVTFKIIVCPFETKEGKFTVIIGAKDDSDKSPIGIDVLGPQKPGKMFLNCLTLYCGEETSWSRKWEKYRNIEGPKKFVADFIRGWKPPTYEYPLIDEDSPILLPLNPDDIEDCRELLVAVEESLQPPQSEMPPTT